MEKGDIIFFFGGAFLLGIFLASFKILLFLGLAAVFILVFGSKRFSYAICGLLVLSLALGYLYFFTYKRAVLASMRLPENSFTAQVSNEPANTAYYKKMKAELLAPYSGKIDLNLPLTREVNFGDIVKIDKFKIKEQENSALPFVSAGDFQIIGRGKPDLKSYLINLKNSLTAVFDKNLSADTSALISGITFGERADFSQALKDDMLKSGTIHLVALSGYNISILVVAIGLMTKHFFSRRLSFWLTIAVICAFLLMTGGEASVIRAAIMGFLVLLAQRSGRVYDMRNSIVLAALLMALYDPFVLRFNLGFILSFLSLLGIVYLGPAIAKYLRWDKDNLGSIKENFLTTVSAQLMVAPVLILSSGQVSVISFIPNMLILFLVPFIMLLGFVLGVLGNLFFWLVFPLVWVLELILKYMLGVMHIFARFSFGASQSLPVWIMVLYYGLIIGLIYFANRKHETI